MPRPKSSNVAFLPLGAIVQEFAVNGKNIVQNFATAEQYREYNSPCFGETIGRVANRVSGAKISGLNGGKSYALAANDGPNSLHGGDAGWGKRVFKGPMPLSKNGKESVLFTYLSPDGEGGYPGTVELRVWYTAYGESVDGADHTVLEAEYEAELVRPDEDIQETIIGLTNHTYFNLAGAPTASTIAGTKVSLCTDKHLPVDDTGIPTGSVEPYPGLLANTAFTLGATVPGIDRCFVVDEDDAGHMPVDTRSLPLRRLAAFYHPGSAIHLEVHSTEPAFHFYTGAFVDVPAIDGLPARGPWCGFCVEPSRYVNAANVDRWRSQVLVRRGARYGSRIVYRAWEA